MSPAYSLTDTKSRGHTLLRRRWRRPGRFPVGRQGIRMELKFSMKSRISFNDRVSDEGDFEVVVERKVGIIKNTIGDFAVDYRLEAMNSFYI